MLYSHLTQSTTIPIPRLIVLSSYSKRFSGVKLGHVEESTRGPLSNKWWDCHWPRARTMIGLGKCRTVIGIAQLHHISVMGAPWLDTMLVRLVREVRRRQVGAKSAPERSLNKGV